MLINCRPTLHQLDMYVQFVPYPYSLLLRVRQNHLWQLYSSNHLPIFPGQEKELALAWWIRLHKCHLTIRFQTDYCLLLLLLLQATTTDRSFWMNPLTTTSVPTLLPKLYTTMCRTSPTIQCQLQFQSIMWPAIFQQIAILVLAQLLQWDPNLTTIQDVLSWRMISPMINTGLNHQLNFYLVG